jgi:hypothetical protein
MRISTLKTGARRADRLGITGTRKQALMRVKPVVLALTVVVALCAAATASANPPTRTPLPPLADNIDPACGFDVFVDYVESNVVSKTFSNAASPVVEILTGVGKVQLTNLETGKTIAVNISGPQVVKVFSDGSVVISDVGPWLFNEVPGLPGIFLSEGRVTIAIDAAGNVTTDGNGRLVDLCAALAA